jgi:hypothetical protein
MRTARSRTSGEKRFDFLLMAPSSQSVEPTQNPGRFTSVNKTVSRDWDFFENIDSPIRGLAYAFQM